MPKITLKFLFLFILLLVFTVNTGSAEDLLWPLQTDLVTKYNWDDVGDVKIWNTKDDYKIKIETAAGFRLKAFSIHIVNDPLEFESILKKTGKPQPADFDYRTDNYEACDILPDSELLVEIPLENETCWGMDPEKCPPDRYIVVYAELLIYDETTGEYVEMDDDMGAYALGKGTFPRLDKDKDQNWGYYVIYPLAKVASGHFVDANVSGMAFETATQSGTTGDVGHFWYIPDERIYLSVGDVYLGNALANHNITPYDLYIDGLAMTEDQALNLAWLLQSLDSDGNANSGPINITEPVVACLNGSLEDNANDPGDFSAESTVASLISDTQYCYNSQDFEPKLATITREEALANLGRGMQAGNIMKKNISKTPGLKSDKAKIEIMPVYVPAKTSDGTLTDVVYYDADGEVLETRNVAKPIVVSYLDAVEGTATTVGGKDALDVFVAISRDDGDTWKRRNISRTAGKSSLAGYPGESWKPMLKVKDNMIFVAWTDKYCRGGRPGYAINVCPDEDGDGQPDPCEICRDTAEGEICTEDYAGDDVYWKDDLYGVGGPQRSVFYEEYPEMGEVPYSCTWTARGVILPDGEIQWFKPERLTSGRRDAYQLFAGAGTDVAFAIVWQEDPKGLLPGDGEGPGDGWSGANTNNKTDVWYSYITLKDFGKIDYEYPAGGHGDNDDLVDTDPELAGRVKAMVPMSLPVRISDNDVCSAENIVPDGGEGDHDYDEEGQGTHRYCGTIEDIGTAEAPGSNPLCAYTVEKTNPKGEIHNVCVTADGRFLDGNTGASRPNIFLQPYMKTLPDGSKMKSAWVIVGYEESKGVGIPPEGEHDDDGCGGSDDYIPVWPVEEDHDDDRYKPDMGKNVIYHSFDLTKPVTVDGGGIINLPETDADGNPVYLLDEFGELLLDWKGDPQLAYENARRVRFITQPKSKAGPSKTVLVALYRQGEEGSGKPADIFMRRMVAPDKGNPYAFGNFEQGAQNLSSVTPTETFEDPFDPEKPIKMLRWNWTPDNLADSSADNPFSDARAHRGALNGDDLLIGYSLTPNWGRKANDKYDFFIRRSFNGGKDWTTDPLDTAIEHNVVFRVPVIDEVNQEVTWDEEVVTTSYDPGDAEPPRNVSNLRNNRMTVEEPRLVKTPGTITNPDGSPTGYPEDIWDVSVYQLAYGLDFNQNTLPDGVEYPKMPLDINYSRTRDKGQRYESVIVTPQGGSGKPQEGWNPLANDKPAQGAAQLRQTPDGSRMYGIWLEESEDKGSDIMFRRVDYR